MNYRRRLQYYLFQDGESFDFGQPSAVSFSHRHTNIYFTSMQPLYLPQRDSWSLHDTRDGSGMLFARRVYR